MQVVLRALVAVVLTLPVAGLACPCSRGLERWQGCCCDGASQPDLVSDARTEAAAPCCCRTEPGERSAIAAVVDSAASKPRAAAGVLVPIAYARDPSADHPIGRIARHWLRPLARAPVYVEVLHLLI